MPDAPGSKRRIFNEHLRSCRSQDLTTIFACADS